jgi:3-methyladenine DNA glycosylase AlkD
MSLDEIMNQLMQMGNEAIKNILKKHGAREPFYGVKVEDLKKIQKKVKFNYDLSIQLYRTGNSDAMYLAGLIAEPDKMTKADLQDWAEKAYWYMISEYTVPWVTAESRFSTELALEWIESHEENIASCGWATLANIVSLKNDELLDKNLYQSLLQRVSQTIHSEKNRVRYTMNGFVIAVGGYCTHLSMEASRIASTLGKVKVDMCGTACKVPDATEYIKKMHNRGLLGKKRKSARC